MCREGTRKYNFDLFASKWFTIKLFAHHARPRLWTSATFYEIVPILCIRATRWTMECWQTIYELLHSAWHIFAPSFSVYAASSGWTGCWKCRSSNYHARTANLCELNLFMFSMHANYYYYRIVDGTAWWTLLSRPRLLHPFFSFGFGFERQKCSLLIYKVFY